MALQNLLKSTFLLFGSKAISVETASKEFASKHELS